MSIEKGAATSGWPDLLECHKHKPMKPSLVGVAVSAFYDDRDCERPDM